MGVDRLPSCMLMAEDAAGNLRLEECENLLHHRIAHFRGADTLKGEA